MPKTFTQNLYVSALLYQQTRVRVSRRMKCHVRQVERRQVEPSLSSVRTERVPNVAYQGIQIQLFRSIDRETDADIDSTEKCQTLTTGYKVRVRTHCIQMSWMTDSLEESVRGNFGIAVTVHSHQSIR